MLTKKNVSINLCETKRTQNAHNYKSPTYMNTSKYIMN